MPKSLINKDYIRYKMADSLDRMLCLTFLNAFPSLTVNDINRTQGRRIGDEGRSKPVPVGG